MRLYKEFLIESVEQAEALPAWSIAIDAHGNLPLRVRIKCEDHTKPWRTTGTAGYQDADMIGWMVLVPISVEDLIRDTVTEALAEQARQAAEADRERRAFDAEVRRRAEEKYVGDAFKRTDGFTRLEES